MKFTVLMPVHDGIPYDLLKKATDSVLHNTLTPDEFIIIADGSISQKKKNFLIVKKKKNLFIKLVFKKKIGISHILNYGLKISKYNIIARVDADDINNKYRFFKQIKFFKKNNLDILGSNIEEDINKAKYIKKVPHKPNLLSFLLRNPINHMSVMYRKDKIIKLGGYPEIKFKEDYALWLLAKMNGYNIANLQEILVKSRLNVLTLGRRKNIKAIISEFKIQLLILKKRPYLILISFVFFFIRIFILLLPNFLYLFVVKRFNRSNIDA
jgi:hypothetical protein